MRRTALGVAAAACAVASLVISPPSAPSARGMLIGLVEEPETLYGDTGATIPLLTSLHTQVLRVNLYWGGEFGVAPRRPFDAADPNDPAYVWDAYDRVIGAAGRAGIAVLLTVYGTPRWANGGRPPNVAPASFGDLRDFAVAAATRYSGSWTAAGGRALPAVRYWTAWNEPNNPVFLSPQYRRSGGRWLMQSARDYVRICNAVYDGVHATLAKDQRVACGLTAPRGNNNPAGTRPSVAPINFLQNLKKNGLKRFDAYAHHPYYTYPGETPTTKPTGAPPRSTRITLGNIDLLIAELTRLYGKKPLWITEYGYQTNPPDGFFGVSYAKQAAYLSQAFAIARRNPRIEMMLWFLLKDEPIVSGWQSGLMTATGKKKPAFSAFQRLRG